MSLSETKLDTCDFYWINNQQRNCNGRQILTSEVKLLVASLISSNLLEAVAFKFSNSLFSSATYASASAFAVVTIPSISFDILFTCHIIMDWARHAWRPLIYRLQINIRFTDKSNNLCILTKASRKTQINPSKEPILDEFVACDTNDNSRYLNCAEMIELQTYLYKWCCNALLYFPPSIIIFFFN